MVVCPGLGGGGEVWGRLGGGWADRLHCLRNNLMSRYCNILCVHVKYTV